MHTTNCPHPYDLQSYADGALTPDAYEAMRAHIDTCASCTARVAELSRLHSVLRDRTVTVPENLRERTLHVLGSVAPVRTLSCSRALQMASEYIDDELGQTERETLEAHLFACDTCYHEYVKMRAAAQAMREAPVVVASADLRDRILVAVGEEAMDEEPVLAASFRPRRIAWNRIIAPAAGIAAAALLTFGVFQIGRQPATDAGETIAAVTTPTNSTDDESAIDPASATVPLTDETADASEPVDSVPVGPTADAEETPITDMTDPAIDEANARESVAGDMPARRPINVPRPRQDREPAAVRAPSRVSPAPAVERPSERSTRPVRVIEPPLVAMAPATTPDPGRRPSGLRSAERTATGTRRRSPSLTGTHTMPTPPLPVELTGVTASRPLPSGGDSPRVTPTTRPAVESMIATAQPAVRPEPRRPAASTRPVVARASEDLEDTPEERLARHSLLDPVPSVRKRLYEAPGDGEERLKERTREINDKIRREERLAKPQPFIIAD